MGVIQPFFPRSLLCKVILSLIRQFIFIQVHNKTPELLHFPIGQSSMYATADN
jgi:hypothetical protein